MTPDKDGSHFEIVSKNLYTCVISDILDSLGRRNQTMLPRIRPLTDSLSLVGRAKTVQATDVCRTPQHPYSMMMEAIDSVRTGDVFVAALNGSHNSAFFGELMSTAVRAAGGRGAVIDGLIRDSRKILDMGFPVFCAGFRPNDSLGRNEVVDHDIPICCAGVTVNPGDLIFADSDGVVVVPREIEEQVIEKALEKVNTEDTVRDELLNGIKISDVYRKHRVL